MTTDPSPQPTTSPPPGRWRRSVAVVALLLGACGWLNIALNDASGDATVAASLLLHLDSRLHEEGTLQWRALAERGMPTRVAADVGRVRAAEGALVAELGQHLPEAQVAGLEGQIEDYHAALDHELSLLSVGRTEDAVAFEREVTTPGFRDLSAWLQERSDAATSRAAQLARLAHVLLVATLAAATGVIGLLVWRPHAPINSR